MNVPSATICHTRFTIRKQYRKVKELPGMIVGTAGRSPTCQSANIVISVLPPMSEMADSTLPDDIHSCRYAVIMAWETFVIHQAQGDSVEWQRIRRLPDG